MVGLAHWSFYGTRSQGACRVVCDDCSFAAAVSAQTSASDGIGILRRFTSCVLYRMWRHQRWRWKHGRRRGNQNGDDNSTDFVGYKSGYERNHHRGSDSHWRDQRRKCAVSSGWDGRRQPGGLGQWLDRFGFPWCCTSADTLDSRHSQVQRQLCRRRKHASFEFGDAEWDHYRYG